MPKTPFTEKELNQFETLLKERKEELFKSIQLKKEMDQTIDKDGDMADLASGLLEEEMALSLSEQDQRLLGEINDALERIENKTYGLCIDTGETIVKARLNIMPYAKRTASAQELFDRKEKNKKLLSKFRSSSY